MPQFEQEREQIETVKALLGNARVLLRLVQTRVAVAAVGQEDLLAPALNDILSADRLVLRAQESMPEQLNLVDCMGYRGVVDHDKKIDQ